ncbi:hypothetical protein FIBSPDRAFT_853532 [Athelia psychrophila]|uniref:Uncharacterized protein n=1 Tax=Athelia psychrophila TaxID=1759441 RepID=A0A166QLM1_9AGAM|nr:hypothetical protein FIBSPDRAFT_853531 [Fibularhizoctonia sp. CBS 109695]KZP27296.1 hypothetical protein FIBSPDRAFT_853532 [Fibularhizoctonia sp. CBS 109695]
MSADTPQIAKVLLPRVPFEVNVPISGVYTSNRLLESGNGVVGVRASAEGGAGVGKRPSTAGGYQSLGHKAR